MLRIDELLISLIWIFGFVHCLNWNWTLRYRSLIDCSLEGTKKIVLTFLFNYFTKIFHKSAFNYSTNFFIFITLVRYFYRIINIDSWNPSSRSVYSRTYTDLVIWLNELNIYALESKSDNSWQSWSRLSPFIVNENKYTNSLILNKYRIKLKLYFFVQRVNFGSLSPYNL